VEHYRIPMAKPDLSGAEYEVVECLRRGWVSMGPLVREFEERFATYLGVKHAIATSSGTAALHLALLAAGVKPGDRVLVPTLTYVATVAAVRYCGAIPVFGDADPKTWGLVRPEGLSSGVTEYAVPVHLYGVPDVRPLARFVIEDAAEALGASVPAPDRTEKPVGTLAMMGVFSFYANKILTTGEGGCVVTDDAGLAEEVRLLRGQGQDPTRRYWHTRVGYNYRMTDLQAAIGISQLARLDEMLTVRRRLQARYDEQLFGAVEKQTPREWTTMAPWVLACLLPKEAMVTNAEASTCPAFRDYVMAQLAEWGIETRPTFPCVHTMPPYREYVPERGRLDPTRALSATFAPQAFPIAEDISARGILLPLHTGMSRDDVDEVCDRLLGLL
jgi:perosamine synthetase